MLIDERACETFWQAYLAQLPADHAHRAAKPDSFGFGGESTLADELAELVLMGRKRATTSLPIEYTSLGEALPRAGDLSIVVGGDGLPVALIERTDVFCVPFRDVDAHYAAVEGEGDGSLSSWREAHTEYFTAVCQRLGERFDSDTRVLCQTIQLVWAGSLP